MEQQLLRSDSDFSGPVQSLEASPLEHLAEFRDGNDKAEA